MSNIYNRQLRIEVEKRYVALSESLHDYALCEPSINTNDEERPDRTAGNAREGLPRHDDSIHVSHGS